MKVKNILIALGITCALLFAYTSLTGSKNSMLDAKKAIEKPMVIVIPSYNNKNWYKKNLDSVLAQNYDNYRIIYVDDASEDGTGKLVKDYISENGAEDWVTLIENKERKGALANLYTMISSCDKNEIIVSVDGDDWLFNNDVLTYLNKIYANPNVWMTYGQFIAYPSNAIGFASQFPQEVVDNNSFRTHGGCCTHLRTFYAGLFQKIDKDDLLYEGKFYPMAWDVAILVPMLEMSGKRSKFIPDVLYVYNWSNPISDDKTNRAFQRQLDDHIRHKKKYELISQF